MKAKRKAQAEAMQKLLNESRSKRERGYNTADINFLLKYQLKWYMRGMYERI